MARKHPSNMLDDDGNQRPDMEAVEKEIARLKGLVTQAGALVGIEFTDAEMDGKLNDRQKKRINLGLHAGMESAVAVAQDCLRYMRNEVLPALTDPKAINALQKAIDGLGEHYREIKADLEAFCQRHDLKMGV